MRGEGGAEGWGWANATRRRRLSGRPVLMPTPCVVRVHTTLKHTLCAAIICARRERRTLAGGESGTRVACVSSTALKIFDRLR
eukprot:scaffold97438_cov63-Phaeocystis_antarctica.AAC.1